MLAAILDEVAKETIPPAWLVVGFGGQIVFGARFIVQWLASERAGRVHVPLLFWYLSIAGGLITFSYACFRSDPVFIVSQITGLAVYIRNLQLHAREKRGAGAVPPAP